MSQIFISYRRDDSHMASRAIFERLAREFGPTQVFIDAEGIEFGVDFVEVLNAQLRGCVVMLVVVGATWLDARDEAGDRRLDDPGDFVRIEVETGLARAGLKVIPVLLDGTPAPKAKFLPESMHSLSRRQGLELDTRKQFDAGMGRMVGALRKILVGGSSGSAADPVPDDLPEPALQHAQPLRRAHSSSTLNRLSR